MPTLKTLDSSRSRFIRAANSLAEAHLREGQTISFTIPTASMWPMLAPGDQVIVRRARAEDVHVGDIVLRSAGQAWIAHRLIGRCVVNGTMFFTTKGDNCPIADEAWPATQLQGAVAAILRDEYRMNLLSSWARGYSTIIALISRSEWLANRLPLRLFSRLLHKSARISLRGIALIGRGVIG